MKDHQIVLHRLLGELDKICRENGIKYCLIGRAALEACQLGEYAIDNPRVQVVMTLANCVVFSELIKQKNDPQRIVESWLNNPNFFGMHMRYCDTDTFYYEADHDGSVQYPCMGIDIIPLAKFPTKPKKQAVFRAVKEGWCVGGKNGWAGASPKRMLAYLFSRTLRLLMGKKRLSRFAFLLESKSSGTLYFQEYSTKQFKCIHRDVWEKGVCRISAGDQELPIFKSTLLFGAHVERTIQDNPATGKVWDAKNTYAAYADILHNREFRRIHRKYLHECRHEKVDISARYYKSLTFVRRSRTLLDRADERIQLEKEFRELKPILMRLLAKEKDKEAYAVLEPYIRTTRKYLLQKHPFCIDPELYCIAMIVLKRTGHGSLLKLFEDNYVKSLKYFRKATANPKSAKKVVEPLALADGAVSEADESADNADAADHNEKNQLQDSDTLATTAEEQ